MIEKTTIETTIEGTERTIQEGLIKGTMTAMTLEIEIDDVMAVVKIVLGNLSQGQTRSVQRSMYKTSLPDLVCLSIYMAH
jgi:hypothetical protein